MFVFGIVTAFMIWCILKIPVWAAGNHDYMYESLVRCANEAKDNNQTFDCADGYFKVWFMYDGCKYHAEYGTHTGEWFGPENIQCVWKP